MEGALDVLVTTPPLHHVTKSRIKSSSRNVSTPSRNHLKKSSVVEIGLPGVGNTAEFQSINMMGDVKKLKLPPPPVPKKPKLKSHINSNGELDSNDAGGTKLRKVAEVTNINTEGKVNAEQIGMKKPEILPKPGKANLTPKKSPTLQKFDSAKKMEQQGLPANTNKQPKTEDPPSKMPLSFSERLKASTLSRRSEQSGPDKTSTKLRSQILSPVRRGSRSYMNVDSVQDKDHTSKPVFKLFKRRSSENKLLENTESEGNQMQNNKENSIQNEELDSLSVPPLSVDSALLTNSFEDEDDSAKDSFDTEILDRDLNLEINLKADTSFSEPGSLDVKLQDSYSSQKAKVQQTMLTNIGKNLDLSPKNHELANTENLDVKNKKEMLYSTSSLLDKTSTSMDYDSTPFNERYFANKQQNIPDNISTLQIKKVPSSESDPTETTKPKSPTSIFSNAKRLRNFPSKEGSNARRRFKPVGSVEQDLVLSPTEETPRERKGEFFPDSKFGIKTEINDQTKGFLKFDTIETDSSLEIVTPDIALDSSHDETFVDEISRSDSSMEPSKDTTAVDIDDESIPLDDIVSGFDLEMVPSGLPPPPIDVDSEDDDMTLNIIDPPTVYEDDESSENDNFTFDEDDIPMMQDDAMIDTDLKSAEKSSGFVDEHLSESINVHSEEKLPALSMLENSEFKEISSPELNRSEKTSSEDLQSKSSKGNVALLTSMFDASDKGSPAMNDAYKPYGSNNDNDNKQQELIENTLDFEEPSVKPKAPGKEFSLDNPPTILTNDISLNDNDYELEQDGDLWDDDIGVPEPPAALPDPPLFDADSDSENDQFFDDSDDDLPVTPPPPPNAPLFDVSDFEDQETSLKYHVFDVVESESLQKDGKQNPALGLSYLEHPVLEKGFDAHVDDDQASTEFVAGKLDFESGVLDVGPGELDLESGSILNGSSRNDLSKEDIKLGMSEKGRERKRSFHSIHEKKEKLQLETEKSNVDNDNEDIVDFPKEEIPVLSEPDMDFIPALNESFTEENDAQRLALQRANIDISIIDDTLSNDNITEDISDISNSRRSSISLNNDVLNAEPSKQTLLKSTSNELQFPDRNRLSPASSIDYLPQSDRPGSRRSSGSSMNKSDESVNLRPVERHLSNRTWSSFNSSDDESDSKLNIVKLMRERTFSQDDGIDGVQLDFDDDERFVDGSEMDLSLGASQNDSMHKFESAPLDQWTVEDVGDWLEMIGFGDLRAKFEERHVEGLELMAIDFQLLDDMGITNSEDRELILSEIYALKNPEDIDIEMSLLDALDNASGYDREKMLAVLEALKMPSEDHDNHYLPPSPSPKLSPRNKKKSGKSRITKDKYRRAVSECLPSPEADDSLDERSKSASPTRNYAGSLAMSMDTGLFKEQLAKDKKTSKKRSFLNAFSFRRKGSRKLGRLFSSRKKLVDSSLKYLLQASPQGVVKILVHRSDLESTFVPLLVTVNTTAAEITKTVLEKLEMVEDANCFYMVQAHTSKSVPEVKLGSDDCPLVLQCRWPDAERYRFEMKKKFDGSVIVVYGGEGSNEERSVKIETTLNTTCEEIMSIALKRLQVKDPVNCFSLLQMKNEKNRQTIDESQIPLDVILLKMTKNLSKPAVYRLVRVNFLGSPEGVQLQNNSHLEVIDNLKEQLDNLNEKLKNAQQIIDAKDNEINGLRREKEEDQQRSLDKQTEILNLKQLIDDLKLEIRKLSESQSAFDASDVVAAEEEILAKLESKENEIKLFKDKIGDLENTLFVKEEEIKSLKDNQKDLELFKDKIGDLENTLFVKEEEIKSLKDNQKDLENQKLQPKDDEMTRVLSQEQTAKIEMFEKENKGLRGTIEELQGMLEVRDHEIEDLTKAKHENEVLSEKVRTFEKITTRKDEQLQEMNSIVEKNEELQDQIYALERTVKQKDRAANETLSSQSEIMELRRTVDRLQNEVIEKEDELENSKEELLELREKLNEDIELKIRTIEGLMTEVQELRSQISETEQEKKELRLKSKEVELLSEERRKKIEDFSNVHEEYKGQHQRIKKLERELTIRNEELQQVSNDKEASAEDLRNHIESLEQNLLDKGSIILDLEFKLQKVERRLKESEDTADEDIREKHRLNLALDDLSQKTTETNKRVENYRRLIAEKDKQIQALKGTQNRADERLKAEFAAVQRELTEKDKAVLQIKQKMDEERMELKSHFATLQELAASKETKWKDREIQLAKEKEDSKLRSAQLETKMNEKEAVIRKLEAKVAKLEVMGRENMRKFEKFMSDKDRMMKQVKENSEKDIQSLKEKLRRMDEAQNEKERQIRQLGRGNSLDQDVIAVKLKQKEEENKQNKYLLERLMSVVNDKDPNLLEQFENSFGSSPNKHSSDKLPLLPKVDEDWC